LDFEAGPDFYPGPFCFKPVYEFSFASNFFLTTVQRLIFQTAINKKSPVSYFYSLPDFDDAADQFINDMQ